MNELSGRIARDIEAYDGQGIHRTGTAVDQASADWLAARIDSLGAEPLMDTLRFQRLEVERAEVNLGDLVISGVPLFDCTYTDAAGVTGTAGEPGSDAEIAVLMSLPFQNQALAELRASGKHRAIVVVTDDRLPAGGVATQNAEHFRAPFGPPVVQVPHDHFAVLKRAAAEGGQLQVIAAVKKVPAVASNVGAVVTGTDPGAPPVVVMTPRSGWWHCASERGGGLACWLEILRRASRSQPRRTMIFTANSGHELGHIGLDHYLEHNASLVRGARLWVHLGANFAAKFAPGVRLQYSDDEARADLAAAMAAEQVTPAVVTPQGERPYGEARNIHDGGGRYVSIVGGNGLFHHPDDRYPDAVDLVAATRWTAVFASAALRAANT